MESRKSARIPEQSEIYRPTSDNWAPNFPDGTVQVSFFELQGGQWRVCVWGRDDIGMERDYAPNDKEAALRLHQRLAGCSDVTRSLCADLGMKYR